MSSPGRRDRATRHSRTATPCTALRIAPAPPLCGMLGGSLSVRGPLGGPVRSRGLLRPLRDVLACPQPGRPVTGRSAPEVVEAGALPLILSHISPRKRGWGSGASRARDGSRGCPRYAALSTGRVAVKGAATAASRSDARRAPLRATREVRPCPRVGGIPGGVLGILAPACERAVCNRARSHTDTPNCIPTDCGNPLQG